MYKKLRTNFITGVIVLMPFLITFWVFYFIISKMNLLFLEPAVKVLERLAPGQNIELLTKGIIFIALLVILTLIGFATRIILLRNIFGFGEKILYRVPMISTVYRSLKELSFAFFVQRNTIFQKVVLVEYPRKGIYSIGFVTSGAWGEIEERTKEDLVNVFVPTTPNPTSGIFILVPKKDLIELEMSVSDGMKMVISGGAVVPRT